jgi:hypothetical protein
VRNTVIMAVNGGKATGKKKKTKLARMASGCEPSGTAMFSTG